MITEATSTVREAVAACHHCGTVGPTLAVDWTVTIGGQRQHHIGEPFCSEKCLLDWRDDMMGLTHTRDEVVE